MNERAAEHAFIFADLSGFTALTEAHGDDDAASIALRFAQITRVCLEGDGRLVKTIGDAVMVVSPDALRACTLATRMMRTLEHEPLFPRVKLGLHVGPAAERDGDYFGVAINLAARVAAHAAPGQILVTEAVVKRVGESARFIAAGIANFKNVTDPVAIFELVWAPSRTYVMDPVCRMKLDPAAAVARIVEGDVTHYFCSNECAEAFGARGPSGARSSVS